MATPTYHQAQHRLLERFGIDAESRFVDVPAVDGRAHVLVTGEGPPVMMVMAAGPPTAMWAGENDLSYGGTRITPDQ